MKVLIIGGGGREAALVWKIAQSQFVSAVFCAPGNAGTARYATNVNIPVTDIDGLVAFAKSENIGLTIVGPEKPLTLGIVDMFRTNGLKIFGPDKKAAILEESKPFTKELLAKYEIPTARYKLFSNYDLAISHVGSQNFPLVIKAGGLAEGKGVYICQNLKEAMQALWELMRNHKFGDAGDEVVIEEFLSGEEASCIVFVDFNRHVLMLEFSQDHKRVGDRDTGPNTGGMGAYSPAPVVTADVREKSRIIIQSTVDAMFKEGRPYTGILYAGLMIANENPKVLEYNVRLGDPETQPLMMRMKSDIVPIILAALEGTLDECEIKWDPRPAVSITMAANGYPGSYQKGFPIEGIDDAEKTGAVVFQAGTALDENYQLISVGGRVVYPTALGETFLEAQHNAYRAVLWIESGGNLFCRKDIAHRAIDR